MPTPAFNVTVPQGFLFFKIKTLSNGKQFGRKNDGLVKSPSAALQLRKGCRVLGVGKNFVFVFFYTLPPIRYPLFQFLRALHIFSVGFMIFMRSSKG
jgi:hypothetical protein